MPVHLTIYGVLVGLERRHIIEDAEEVFAIIRGRSHRSFSDSAATEWQTMEPLAGSLGPKQ
jgi:hypothetical protein